jgi:hypothetical protein
MNEYVTFHTIFCNFMIYVYNGKESDKGGRYRFNIQDDNYSEGITTMEKIIAHKE